MIGWLKKIAKSRVSPAHGELGLIRYRGRDWLTAQVPDDERFALLRELILLRVYESNGVRLPSISGTVLDAGGHVGLFSLLAGQYARRVIVLEASRDNVEVARRNAARNDLDNVEIRHCALWHEPGTVSFETGHHTGGGIVGQGEDMIRTVTLDEIVSETGPIDLLKIDIEGAEYAVLAGAERLDQIGAIVGELHDAGPDDPRRVRLVQALGDAGFTFELITERDLFARRYLRRLLENWSTLEGNLELKLLLLAYFLAPVRKPIKPAGARELPLFVARRVAPAPRRVADPVQLPVGV